MEPARDDQSGALLPLVEVIRECLGLSVGESDLGKLAALVKEQRRDFRAQGIQGYVAHLRRRPTSDPEWLRLTGALTVTEGFFFRDPGQFALLERLLLPELLERAGPGQPLRFWSAGCGLGEEPYSLAMLIKEQLGHRSDRVTVLGTDINAAALAHARRGAYREWSLRRLDLERRRRWFRQEGDHWVLVDSIRAMVEFRWLNLMEQTPGDVGFPTPVDLIVCRNVFIYFTDEARQKVVNRLIAALRLGGYLVTGHNELFGLKLEGLKPRLMPEGIVYCREPPAKAGKPPLIHLPPRLPPLSRRIPRRMPRRPPPVKKAVPRAPVTGKRPLDAAWTAANSGRLQEAERLAREALSVRPTDAEAHFLLAYLENEAGHLAEARRQLQRVLYLDPHFIPAYVEFAALYDREGNPRAARRIRRAGLSAMTDLPKGRVVAAYQGVTVDQLAEFLRQRVAEDERRPP